MIAKKSSNRPKLRGHRTITRFSGLSKIVNEITRLWRRHHLSYDQTKYVVEQVRRHLALQPPGVRRRTVERLAKAEVERLIQSTYESHSKYGLMIKTLFMTGTRVAEFVHIQVKDLHLDANPPQIYITHSKRDAKLYVPILPIQILGLKDSYLSQDVLFVGFPYGLSIDGHALNAGFPLPLVKHGIIAAFGNGRGEPFLVDGINNPRFSGGPVVRSENPNKPTIIGVVSGYKAVHESVYKERARTDDLTVRTNTGLLVAFDIEYAIEAIKMNPIGYRVQSAP